MIFSDPAVGDAVFVDANTFIYHFAPDPLLEPPCSHLLQRIENRELEGFTSLHLLSEVAHKLMVLEASTRFGWPLTGMANRLRRHPAEVQQLTLFRRAIERIAQSRIQVLATLLAALVDATSISQQLGLLTNDALIVALMQANGLKRLASHDADFDRVPGLMRYAPL